MLEISAATLIMFAALGLYLLAIAISEIESWIKRIMGDRKRMKGGNP